MKARVIATGERVDVKYVFGYFDHNYETQDGKKYHSIELDFSGEPDYWTRLEHTYAGMAMQGMLSNPECDLDYKSDECMPPAVAATAYIMAHALVQKLKEMEE